MCLLREPAGSPTVLLSPPFAVPPAAVLAQIADALPWSLLLLRGDAVLLHANLAARQVLQRGQPLRIDAGLRVVASDPQRRAAFASALRAAEPALIQWPAPGHAGCSLALKPLATAGDAESGPPMLVVLASAASRHADLHAFARLHALSAAEARVLERLSLGHSCADAAVALGTKAATVRSQVASMRRKTGHASVAALLRAVATMPPVNALHLVQPLRDGAGE